MEWAKGRGTPLEEHRKYLCCWHWLLCLRHLYNLKQPCACKQQHTATPLDLLWAIQTGSYSSNSPGYWCILGWETFTALESLINHYKLIKKEIRRVTFQLSIVPWSNKCSCHCQARRQMDVQEAFSAFFLHNMNPMALTQGWGGGSVF